MISTWFKRKEFACKCGCGFNPVDAELLKVLEGVRVHFNKPVIITSGCRCESHNKKIGGAVKSKHLLGIAADIKVKDVAVQDVYNYLCAKYTGRYGIKKYKTWIHIDVREGVWREKSL